MVHRIINARFVMACWTVLLARLANMNVAVVISSRTRNANKNYFMVVAGAASEESARLTIVNAIAIL